MQNKPISPETLKTVAAIAPFFETLAKIMKVDPATLYPTKRPLPTPQ